MTKRIFTGLIAAAVVLVSAVNAQATIKTADFLVLDENGSGGVAFSFLHTATGDSSNVKRTSGALSGKIASTGFGPDTLSGKFNDVTGLYFDIAGTMSLDLGGLPSATFGSGSPLTLKIAGGALEQKVVGSDILVGGFLPYELFNSSSTKIATGAFYFEQAIVMGQVNTQVGPDIRLWGNNYTYDDGGTKWDFLDSIISDTGSSVPSSVLRSSLTESPSDNPLTFPLGIDLKFETSIKPLVTVVPEPASLAVWGIGALGLGLVAGIRRRRNKKS